MPVLSITIVNYNQKYFPRLCLEALKKSKTDFEYEIIVCDNNSEDESLDFLRGAAERGEIKLLEPKRNLGYGAGHNFAAKEARGRYICILNTDITVEPDTLQKLVDFLRENEGGYTKSSRSEAVTNSDGDVVTGDGWSGKVGMAGPKLIYHDGTVQPSCRRDFGFLDLFIKRTFLRFWGPFKKRYENYLMKDFDRNKVQDVDLITGAFMVMPRDLFEKIGGFDERYFMFMEDFDLCRKVRQEGKKVVYYPLATAVHYHKRLSEGSIFRLPFKKISWYHLASAIKYFWKWRKEK